MHCRNSFKEGLTPPNWTDWTKFEHRTCIFATPTVTKEIMEGGGVGSSWHQETMLSQIAKTQRVLW